MHIVQIIPELNQGGVERGTVELSRELVKRGHASTVISAGGKLAARIEQDGGMHITMDVCSKNPLTFPFRVQKLRRILRSLSSPATGNRQPATAPMVLHARSRVPAWLCRFANKFPGIPFVTTVHGFNSISRYSAVMTEADAVICVSHPLKDYIQTHYGTIEDKITVIHRGVDPAEFDPENLNHEWIESFKVKYSLRGKYVVTSVGRITELKDYETLIRAISDCACDIPNILGLIVGGVRHDKQAYFERLQNLIRELHVEDRMVFAGSHRHMPEIYALSDVLISCSRKPESFGRTMIEAMAMNTPVIATRHGGALDIIEEGQTGFLVDPGNPDALAAALRRQKDIESAGLRDYILSRFLLEQMVDKTIGVYERLVNPATEH